MPAASVDILRGTRTAMEQEMMEREACSRAAHGAFERTGEMGRLLRRFTRQAEADGPEVFNLSGALRGVDQVGGGWVAGPPAWPLISHK